MKKIVAGALPLLVMHLFCCGALLIFLISSGLLLTLSKEGNSKTFLLPVLLAGGALLWLYQYHGKSCRTKGYKNITDHILSISIYILISLIFALAFIIYIFIPWWIPDYKGGFLLP